MCIFPSKFLPGIEGAADQGMSFRRFRFRQAVEDQTVSPQPLEADTTVLAGHKLTVHKALAGAAAATHFAVSDAGYNRLPGLAAVCGKLAVSQI